MTKEQFEVLHKHEHLLFSVARTMTMVAVEPNIIDELYNVYIKLGYRATSMRCNTCVIGMMLTLYRLHEENKDQFKTTKKDAIKVHTDGKASGRTRTHDGGPDNNKKA